MQLDYPGAGCSLWVWVPPIPHVSHLGHLSLSISKHYCDWQVWTPLQRKTGFFKCWQLWARIRIRGGFHCSKWASQPPERGFLQTPNCIHKQRTCFSPSRKKVRYKLAWSFIQRHFNTGAKSSVIIIRSESWKKLRKFTSMSFSFVTSVKKACIYALFKYYLIWYFCLLLSLLH